MAPNFEKEKKKYFENNQNFQKWICCKTESRYPLLTNIYCNKALKSAITIQNSKMKNEHFNQSSISQWQR